MLKKRYMLPEEAWSFPNATYYVQRRELEYAFEKGPSSYLTDELTCLRQSPQVVFLDGDGVLDGYIRYKVTGAHCPWHQAFWMVDGGETAFFGGDVAPQLQQMKSRFVAKYDYDGKLAMELRQQWWQQGQQEAWTFLFIHHDVKTPVFSLRDEEPLPRAVHSASRAKKRPALERAGRC